MFGEPAFIQTFTPNTLVEFAMHSHMFSYVSIQSDLKSRQTHRFDSILIRSHPFYGSVSSFRDNKNELNSYLFTFKILAFQRESFARTAIHLCIPQPHIYISCIQCYNGYTCLHFRGRARGYSQLNLDRWGYGM